MLSDEEKSAILERLEYGRQIAALDSPKQKPERPKRWEWLNGPLALLLVTSIVSALIVPSVQSHQQELEWKRQTRSESMKARLDSMRDCLKQFTQVSSFTTEALELGTRIVEPDVLDLKDCRTLRERLLDMQLQRVNANAKLLASLTFFDVARATSDPDKAALRKDVRAYIDASTQYIDGVRSLATIRLRLLTTKDGETLRQFKRQLQSGEQSLKDFSESEESFATVVDRMEKAIDEEQRYFEGLRF